MTLKAGCLGNAWQVARHLRVGRRRGMVGWLAAVGVVVGCGCGVVGCRCKRPARGGRRGCVAL